MDSQTPWLNETIVKRGRGRPAKQQYASMEDLEDDIIIKWLNNEPLTLEETGVLLWMKEGRKTAKPYSKATILQIERSAISKIKSAFAKLGINDMEDIRDVLQAR